MYPIGGASWVIEEGCLDVRRCSLAAARVPSDEPAAVRPPFDFPDAGRPWILHVYAIAFPVGARYHDDVGRSMCPQGTMTDKQSFETFQRN